MNSTFLSAFAAVALVSPLSALVTPETTLVVNSATHTHTLSWHGEVAHTYFIQHSLDLLVWQTVPIIETGNNAPLSWSMQLVINRTFFRLLASDLPTGGNPETADFDGDGLNNLAEINLGANPISLDGDHDGMPDAWEYQHGFSLTQPGATANADTDALSNLAEYLAATNPNAANANAAASTLGLLISSP
jgi:hypothetical protein